MLCVSCRRNKPSNRKPAGLLNPFPTPLIPWLIISLDFITHLPKTDDGYDCIMVVIDKFSKRAHFIPTTSERTAHGTAQLFFDTVWKAHTCRKLPPIQGPPLAHREPPPSKIIFFSRHRYSKRYVLNIARAFEQSLFKIVYEPTRKNKQAAAFRNNICEVKELVRLRRR